MNWKIKAYLQNLFEVIPASETLYYFIQKNFGGLKALSPIPRFIAAQEIKNRLTSFNESIKGKSFFEVGTGRRINIPIALWLLGADKIITVDLNKYLKEELVKIDMHFLRNHRKEIKQQFNDDFVDNRFDELMEFTDGDWRLEDLLELCNIIYSAPLDASKTLLDKESIDFHFSYFVLEHIPRKNLEEIFAEGNRILKKSGKFIHRIDHTDHFAHSDSSVSYINFLQYNKNEWNKIVRNKYMYMNRLRADDYIEIFRNVGHNILSADNDVSEKIRELIYSNKIKVDEEFKSKRVDDLSTISSWIISEKKS